MNNKKVDSMADRISEEITAGLADVMKPVFENLAKEIHTVVTGLEDRQKENMKNMADAFLQEMAQASDRMFEGIVKETAGICRMQSKTVKELSGIVDKIIEDRAVIQKSSENNAAVAADMAKLAGMMGEQIDRLAKISGSVAVIDRNTADRMNAETALYANLEQRSGEWAKQLANCNEMVACTSEDVTGKINDSTVNAVQNIDRCSEKLEQITKDIQVSYDRMNKDMQAVMKEYRDTVSRDITDTFKAFDENMSHIVKTLGTVVTDIADAADKIPKALKGSIDALQQSAGH